MKVSCRDEIPDPYGLTYFVCDGTPRVRDRPLCLCFVLYVYTRDTSLYFAPSPLSQCPVDEMYFILHGRPGARLTSFPTPTNARVCQVGGVSSIPHHCPPARISSVN